MAKDRSMIAVCSLTKKPSNQRRASKRVNVQNFDFKYAETSRSDARGFASVGCKRLLDGRHDAMDFLFQFKSAGFLGTHVFDLFFWFHQPRMRSFTLFSPRALS